MGFLEIEDVPEDEPTMAQKLRGSLPPDLVALGEAHPATAHLFDDAHQRRVRKRPPGPAPVPPHPLLPEMEGLDFVADAEATTSSPIALRDLARLAKKLLHEMDREAFYLDKLKECRSAKEKLEAQEIPDAMDAAGLKEFTTPEGKGIVIKDIVSGSITEPKRAAALAWLRDHGHEGLIKRAVAVTLPRGVGLPAPVKRALEQVGATVEEKETVHAQTLCAWAREMLREGHDFPPETLGIYVGRRATVK